MATQLSQIKWGRILVAALVVYIVSLLTVFSIIFGYAFVLGFQARGAPDPEQIRQFASQIAPWGGRLGLIVFTAAAAAWVARRVEAAPELHGVLLGVVVGLPNIIISRSLSLEILASILLTIAAGWVGSVLGRQRR